MSSPTLERHGVVAVLLVALAAAAATYGLGTAAELAAAERMAESARHGEVVPGVDLCVSRSASR